MTRRSIHIAASVAAFLLPAAAGAQVPAPTPQSPKAAVEAPPIVAHADLADASGKAVGKVTLTDMPEGVLLRVEIAGLPSGWHGFHFHEVGKCQAPFASAGGHVNPTKSHHGLGTDGPHRGDLPNIYVGDDGKAMLELIAPSVSLKTAMDTGSPTVNRAVGAVAGAVGSRTNLIDDDGTALVVHAKADDYKTDPSGDSGDRIACGVITK